MIDYTTLLTYCAIVLGFVFIPGPATLLTIARATTSGTKIGIVTGAGISVADIIHTLFAVVGISAIIAASSTLFGIIKYLGAIYLLYLGVRTIRQRETVIPERERVHLSVERAFRQAVLTELFNPKTTLFFLAFLPQFVRPENGVVFLQLLLLGVLFAMIGFGSTLIFALGAGKMGNFLRRYPRVLKWQGKVVGCIYCGLGIRLALQQR
ncbi:LysE family translocator [Lonsdalea quercina]|uniref:LysE family translocator n=1 Tax=Lonsdalea quercina TaxID=71657 RepID=UPI0039754424